MTKYKAIICDIDGTLTSGARDDMPSKVVRKAVQNAQNKGAHVTLASGRPYFMLGHLVELLNIKSPIISDNGAVITSGGSDGMLWQSTLDVDTARKVIEMISDAELYRITTDVANKNCDNPTHIEPNTNVRKISIHDMLPAKAEDYIKKLEELYPELAIMKAASFKGKRYTDIYISNKLATKSNAVKEFAKLLNISTEEIIGIGDGYNDIPMFESCGLKVAMGNAIPELKQLADEIAPSVENDGLAEILKKYFC